MVLSWWRLKSLAALVLDQPTELAGQMFWQQTRKHDWTKKPVRAQPVLYGEFFGGLHGVVLQSEL